MRKLEIRHLMLVKTIVETGTMTKASTKLFITQPALSRQLLDIENKLEAELFTRTKKKMVLTRVGEKVYKTAVRVLKELSRVENDIQKSVHGETGVLRIGVHCIMCFKWLPKVMKKFQKQFPKVELEIHCSENSTKDLLAGKVDTVITSFPMPNDGIVYEKLFGDEVLAVMHPDDNLARKKHIKKEDFDGCKMIGFTEKSKDGYYRFVLEPAGIEPAMFMQIRQPEAVIELVKEGFGIALLPRWTVRPYLEKGEISGVAFAENDMHLTWSAALLNTIEPPFYMRQFISQIRELPFARSLT